MSNLVGDPRSIPEGNIFDQYKATWEPSIQLRNQLRHHGGLPVQYEVGEESAGDLQSFTTWIACMADMCCLLLAFSSNSQDHAPRTGHECEEQDAPAAPVTSPGFAGLWHSPMGHTRRLGCILLLGSWDLFRGCPTPNQIIVSPSGCPCWQGIKRTKLPFFPLQWLWSEQQAETSADLTIIFCKGGDNVVQWLRSSSRSRTLPCEDFTTPTSLRVLYSMKRS